MSCTPEPVIQSCNTGQQIPYFYSCQLILLWIPNVKGQFRLNQNFLNAWINQIFLTSAVCTSHAEELC